MTFCNFYGKVDCVKYSCRHQRLIEVKTPVYNDYTGDESIDVSWEYISTFEDIDTHRYRCTQCGKIEYYSQAAEDYYTKGTKNPMLGPDYD